MKMNRADLRFFIALVAALLLLSEAACDRSTFSGSKLTLANYNLVTDKMSKGQVQQILGPPTTMETRSMVFYEKTTYRYEDGKKFAVITFKNDELDSKDTNLGTQ
jgi:outer membrane protein assembly factor BamE (lipoprotein component of BamABCDE complex)